MKGKYSDHMRTAPSGDNAAPLRVCLDARKILDGGIGVYIQNTITGLLRNGVKLTLLVNEIPNLKELESDQITVVPVSSRPFTLRELFSLSSEVDWSEIDLFHTPNYILPFSIPVPTVITVHDFIHLRHPEKRFYPFIALPLFVLSILRAEKIVAVSRATQGELARLSRWIPRARGKISLVTNGLLPSFRGRKPNPDYVKTRFGVRPPFLLSVFSTVKPHKGLPCLLDAFSALQEKGMLRKFGEPRLVLVGQGTEGLLEAERLLKRADALNCVHLLGRVSAEDLFQLYAAAKGLIVPSLCEGFCLPVIEAQSVGTPVIARPLPAIVENASPRDVIAEDLTTASLVEAIGGFLSGILPLHAPTAEELEVWNSHFALRFDPERLGGELLDVYHEATHPHFKGKRKIVDRSSRLSSTSLPKEASFDEMTVEEGKV